MTFTRSMGWIPASIAALTLCGLALAWGEPPTEEVNRVPSSYAPAKDLQFQVNYLMQRIDGDLKNEPKYDRHVKRVMRDANTIAVLALVMGKHDEQNTLKGTSTAVIKAAHELSAKAKDLGAAKSAYAVLVARLKSPSSESPTAWKGVGDIEQLMQQIPELDRSLKIAVKPTRFAKSREKAASLAATMAALAQVSMFDGTYCTDAADEAEWVELCVCLRDAATDVHAAIQEGDSDAATAALKPLARTCDDCHEQFKD